MPLNLARMSFNGWLTSDRGTPKEWSSSNIKNKARPYLVISFLHQNPCPVLQVLFDVKKPLSTIHSIDSDSMPWTMPVNPLFPISLLQIPPSFATFKTFLPIIRSPSEILNSHINQRIMSLPEPKQFTSPYTWIYKSPYAMSDHTVSPSPQPPQLLQPYSVTDQPALISPTSQAPPQPQPQQTSQPKGKKARAPKKAKKEAQPPPFNIQTFTLEMQPIGDISRYPIYCRRDDKKEPSAPVVRARRIFDTGKEVTKGKACSRCLEHGQICVRAPGFSKCSYCTAEDLHPKGMCHLPGIADPPESDLSVTALSKKRKMDARTDAASATTVYEAAYGQSHFQVLPSAKRGRGLTENPVSRSVGTQTEDISMTSDSVHESIAPCPASTLNAISEKVAALEDRVSSLEKVQVVEKDMEAETSATSEDMDGPEMTKCVRQAGDGEHSIVHPVGFSPINCKCMQRGLNRSQSC